VLAAVNTASRRLRGGLRPMLTAAARGHIPKVQAGTEKLMKKRWFYLRLAGAALERRAANANLGIPFLREP
jgi:hypothetical protein